MKIKKQTAAGKLNRKSDTYLDSLGGGQVEVTHWLRYHIGIDDGTSGDITRFTDLVLLVGSEIAGVRLFIEHDVGQLRAES